MMTPQMTAIYHQSMGLQQSLVNYIPVASGETEVNAMQDLLGEVTIFVDFAKEL
jgi:hypothetical protein